MEADKMVLVVFKVILSTVLLMILLDTSIVVVDMLNINKRVQAVNIQITREVSKYNCLTDEAAKMFEKQIEKLVAESKIASGYEVNFKEIGETQIKEYGELQEIKVNIKIAPSCVYFRKDPKGKSLLGKEKREEMTLRYTQVAPCTRYLK